MDGVQLPQGQSHLEEAVYFLPQKELEMFLFFLFFFPQIFLSCYSINSNVLQFQDSANFQVSTCLRLQMHHPSYSKDLNNFYDTLSIVQPEFFN